MLASILEQGVAFARDAAAALEIAGMTAWTWVQAQPIWLTVSIATGVKVATLIPFVLSRRRAKRARSVAAATPVSSEAKVERRRPTSRPAGSRPVSGAQSALELVSHGVPAIEISRQTGLSRDAVSLLLARSGSLAARQGRPVAAGVAVSMVVDRRASGAQPLA